MRALPVVAVGLVLTGCAQGDPGSGVPSPSVSDPAASASDPTGTPTPARTSAAPPPSPGATIIRVPDPAEQRALNTKLIEAAWDDDVPRARRLIRRGADVDWRDDSAQNAFLIAASEGYLDLLELTVRSGADVRLHDSFDGTAIIRAAERGHWDIVGRLLRTPLRAQLDHVNNLGWVALHEAIILGEATPDDLTTVRVLVAGGADLTVPTERGGMTALEHARAKGQGPVVRTLERAQPEPPADPDAALLEAARAGDADGAAIAIRAGADLGTRDAAGRTARQLAVARERSEVARILAALGAG